MMVVQHPGFRFAGLYGAVPIEWVDTIGPCRNDAAWAWSCSSPASMDQLMLISPIHPKGLNKKISRSLENDGSIQVEGLRGWLRHCNLLSPIRDPSMP